MAPAWPNDDWAGGRLTIDLAAIVDNWRDLAALSAPAECAAVVKADAYGLGVARVAPALAAAGCRSFFVAHLAEGVALRGILGPDPRILVLNGIPPGTAAVFAAHALRPVLNSAEQIAEWRGLSDAGPAALQLDTGMSRFGLPPETVATLASDALAGIRLELVMSHLACADQPEHPANAAQRDAFVRLRAAFPGIPASLAASSGLRLGPEYRFDLTRPGASLYGVPPTEGVPNPMRGVVRLQGRVAQLRRIPEGSFVGYGARFTAHRASRIATIAIGYADGFLRAAGGRGQACHVESGQRLPIIGRISMDSLALDATDLPEGQLREGSLLDLIGPHWRLEEAAAAAGTIGYELLTSLGQRYSRHYLG